MARPMICQSAISEPWLQYLKQLKSETPDYVPEQCVRGMDSKPVREPLEAVADAVEKRVAWLRAKHFASQQPSNVVPFGRRGA